MRYGFVIDQRKCIGCHACTVACKEENQVPLGVNRTWVKYIEKGTFPDTRRYFSVMRCNHCDNAPCVTICPTVALYRRTDGIVDFDGDRCIGCKSCMQACPYDALYIDPDTHTAAKCHYCAHRVEVGLEPACVIICPVQAIIPGDLDDPGSEIARLVASQQVQVRKPEQGTQPKLFYLGAEEAALTPAMQTQGAGYIFAQRSAIPTPGQRNQPLAGAPLPADEPVDLLRLARTAYDVAHPERPWGWKVSSYLWTKSIAAGALLVAALGALAGGAGGPAAALAGIWAPLIALVFLAATTGLLVADLKRPERFLYLLFKPNPRSWLVWGGWILIAFGAAAVAWLTAGYAGDTRALTWLAWPVIALAVASAGYSAFLFGQAEGRDFWQSPAVLPHLLVAALIAGSSALLLVAIPLGSGPAAIQGLRMVLGGSLIASGLLILSELYGFHTSQDAARAAHTLTRPGLGGPLWTGVLGAGTLLPLALLAIPAPALWPFAALLSLAALWLWEDLWVRAGQSVPLS